MGYPIDPAKNVYGLEISPITYWNLFGIQLKKIVQKPWHFLKQKVKHNRKKLKNFWKTQAFSKKLKK